MDMLGIECIIVRGTSWQGEEEHMWNMVRLEDGEWYCVDVTWNDTLYGESDAEGAPVPHKYFNVTSDFMRANDHQWNELRVPVAASEKYM
jgi:transglutaminase/protease-like cytokinesis protein 3